MKEPSIAAVITTHQRASALQAALTSVQRQTIAVREILICEDGDDPSTRTAVEAASHADPRIRHLHLKAPARGAGANRNLGISVTDCEWIAFLDDDDRWLPDKLERQLPLFSGADVVCANALRSSGGAYFTHPRSGQINRRDLLLANRVITSTCVVRREALDSIGGFSPDYALLGVEDYECWLRLSDAGARFAYVDRPLAEYADQGDDRLSARTVKLAGVVARIAWQRAIRERTDAACWAAAGRHAVSMGTTRARRAMRGPS